MKKILLVGLIFFLIADLREGQALNTSFLNSSVFISFQMFSGRTSFGSGFLVFKQIDKDEGHVFLVTNKHLLPPEGPSKSIKIRVVRRIGDNVQITGVNVPVVGKNGKYLLSVYPHPKKDVDIAVINITKQIKEQEIQANWIPLSLFATKNKLNEENITIGDEIFLLGYPDAIYDPRNVSPILRQGVISTEPTQGYAFNDSLRKKYPDLPERIDGFLIDANVFPGSSGSLVILKPQSTTLGPHGSTMIGDAKKTPYVLGIVSGSIPIIEFYKYGEARLPSFQRMGLGIVYSAESIKETIEQFYKSTRENHTQ